MIHFDNVSKRYDTGHVALNSVSFDIRSGEMAFLTGHSGAGKSTLLKLIMMIQRPTQGVVTIDNENLHTLSRSEIPYHRRKIGCVFQDHQLLFDRSVYDNVALPLIIAGYPSRDIPKRVRAALDKVGLLTKEKHSPATLSGGQQQRVGVARAVVHKPTILLADEPTGNLDNELSLELMHLFEEFNQVGVTVLLATHNLSLIAAMPHRMITLREGEVITGRNAYGL